MSIEDDARKAVDGHPAPRHAPPASPLRDLHDIATRLNANPLIAAIDAHPGMGQRLTDQDVDAIMRVIASIETARIEVPQRYQHAATVADMITPDT